MRLPFAHGTNQGLLIFTKFDVLSVLFNCRAFARDEELEVAVPPRFIGPEGVSRVIVRIGGSDVLIVDGIVIQCRVMDESG